MASAPPNNLPLFYNALDALSSVTHANFHARAAETASFLAKTHAVPITVDEFVMVQRFYPIIFSVGDTPVPLALMGLNEGVNVFVDEDGKLLQDAYIPAYIRRYPFMLARIRADTDELSLCFDPESGLVGEFEEGSALFENGQTTEATKSIVKFCEEFEMSAQRTNAFMIELLQSGVLIDGEVSIQPSDSDQPFIYRGFRMVDENKVRDLRGDTLRKMNQSGMLPLIMAHMFSLPMIREVFGKQMAQGKAGQPVGDLQAALN